MRKHLHIHQRKFISAGVLLLVSLVYKLFLSVSLKDILLFITFQLLVVILPGFALTKLMKLKLPLLELSVLSYGLGLLVVIAVYFCLAPLKLAQFIPYGVILIVLLSVVTLYLTRSTKTMKPRITKSFIASIILASFTFILTFMVLSMASATPDTVGARSYHHDLTNGIALITSASFGFPMEFLQMAGTPHFYHPFFYAYCAVMKLTVGFSAFDIGSKYALVTIAPFYTLAFSALIRRLFVKSKQIWIAVISVFLLFPPFFYYVSIDLLGFSLSIGFACCSVLFMLKAETRGGKIFNRYHIISMLFMVGCLGAKGSNGVTLVFALCFYLLVSLFQKARFGHVALTGLLYATPFFGAYFLLYQQGAESMILRNGLMQNERLIYYSTLNDSWPQWLKLFCSNMMYTIIANPVLILCLIVIAVGVFIRGKRVGPIETIALGAGLAGIVLSNMFLQHGSSEVYFLHTAIPFAFAGAYRTLKRIWLVFKEKFRTIAILLSTALLLAFSFSQISMTTSGVGEYLKKAVNYSSLSAKPRVSSISESQRPAVLTPDEYEGLLYIRDNTEKTAVIADGRYLIYNKYFMGTAFAERRFFLEGWGYVTMEDSNNNTPEKIRRDSVMSLFYGVEEESFVPLLRSYGIDYIIIYRYQNPDWVFTNEFGSKTVFANDDITIYDIREGYS
ncbi:MAG: hypothetical protein FWG21_02355 [Oscillospiraceae bacterium]|nr:hypothetical protein [Oscillospiraceae bacterium]